MGGLLQAFQSLGWATVKVTQYGHGVCSIDGRPCGCQPSEHSFVLVEERNPQGRGDTCRFLAAGARRSLWLRVRQGQLAEAYPALERAVKGEHFVMIESNSILDHLNPDLYIVVLDRSCRDFKTSARRFFARADALVTVEPRSDAKAWPGIDLSMLENKPLFPVSISNYFSPQLCRFVSQKLTLPGVRCTVDSISPRGSTTVTSAVERGLHGETGDFHS